MDRRIDHLVEQGLARRQGQRVVFARDLLNTLRRRELDEAAANLSAETGLSHRPSAEGEHVSGVYRQRVTLASGRFAMIDDGMGFQLVPWRPALEQQLGRHISGVIAPGGNVDWSFGRKRGNRNSQLTLKRYRWVPNRTTRNETVAPSCGRTRKATVAPVPAVRGRRGQRERSTLNRHSRLVL